MTYKEIGTQQPFVEWETITPTEYAVLGQLGLYAYQPTPSTTSINLDALDLNQIKAAIDKGNVTVAYMRVSWNISGSTVTDFVFGMVANLKHPCTPLDVWNTLPSNLIQIFTDLKFTGTDFTWTLLGAKQAANTYTWTWEAYTPEYATVTGGAPTDASLKAGLEATGTIQTALDALVAKASEGGLAVTIRTYTIQLLKSEYLRTVSGGYQGVDKDYYRTHLVLTVDFDTDKPIMGSPIAFAIIVAIAVAISVMALLTGIGIVLYLQGLSTYKSETTQRTVLANNSDSPQTFTLPDGTTVTVPAHSTYEYSKTESTEGGGASIIAQLPLIIVGTVVILGAVIVASRFIGGKKS